MPAHQFSVPGMTCDHCKAAITAAVGAIPGVSSVDVDLAGLLVTVGGSALPDTVRTAIEGAGYDVAALD